MKRHNALLDLLTIALLLLILPTVTKPATHLTLDSSPSENIFEINKRYSSTHQVVLTKVVLTDDDILEEALDAAKTIEVANIQGVWLSNIARNLAKAGNIEQALDAAKYIGSPRERKIRAFLDISINLKLMSPPMNTKREPEVAQKILNLAFSK